VPPSFSNPITEVSEWRGMLRDWAMCRRISGKRVFASAMIALRIVTAKNLEKGIRKRGGIKSSRELLKTCLRVSSLRRPFRGRFRKCGEFFYSTEIAVWIPFFKALSFVFSLELFSWMNVSISGHLPGCGAIVLCTA
jgi:hypothetical protein